MQSIFDKDYEYMFCVAINSMNLRHTRMRDWLWEDNCLASNCVTIERLSAINNCRKVEQTRTNKFDF